MPAITTDRRKIIDQLKHRHVQAWARDTDAPMPMLLLCWDCVGDHSGDTPLGYDELCALYVAEGSVDFPVCDACGKDLGAPRG